MTEYVVIYEQAENGDWNAFIPDLPGVYAAGDTREEAERLIQEAAEAAVAWDREHGPPPDDPAVHIGSLRV